MKLLLIVPCKARDEREFFDFRFVAQFIGMKRGFWGMPLALPTVAALTPPEIEVRIIDENIEEIDFDEECDLVGITVMTLQAVRAYEIADEFRRRGRSVVLGGVHVSMLPHEAAAHADSVFVGEAEGRWLEVIEDARNGTLKPLYLPETPEKPELSLSPAPRRDLLRNELYVANLLQTSRGCPFDCDFCSVQDFLGSRMRYKSPAQVRDEIRDIYRVAVHDNYLKQLFLTDDNLVGNRSRARELLTEALIPMNREFDISGWTCQCSVNVGRDLELLGLMKQAGCQHIFIGFESLSTEGLAGLAKGGVNKVERYGEAIRTIRDHGIDVIGSFILGTDADDTSSFPRLVEFIHENALLDNLINVLVPFPGTQLFRRMESQGRLLHRDWSRYDLGHVVFRPARLSPRELEEGYIWTHEQVYRLENLYPKLRHHIWKEGTNTMGTALKLKFTARMLSYLSATDWDRNRFIGRVLPDIYNPRLGIQLSNIVNVMDHQDFARRLGARRRQMHLLPE